MTTTDGRYSKAAHSGGYLPAQMYVGISQPENLDRIWVIPDVGIRA